MMAEVEPLHAAPAPVPSAPILRRANVTQEALEAASHQVIKTLTDERLGQCFPTYKDDLPELMHTLKKMVEDKYNEGIPKAWKIVVDTHDFIAKADELDRIVADAEARKARGEEPRNLYLQGADAHTTVASATTPLLRAAAAEFREKRLALAAKNAATYDEILKSHAEYERTERQVKDILDDFQKALANLSQVDSYALAALQDQLVQVVPDDEL